MKKIVLLAVLFSFSAFAQDAKKFSHESELSVVTAGGNSKLETYNAKTSNTYKLNTANLLAFGGHYTLGSASEVISTRNWDANLRFEHVLNEKFNVYLGEIVEGDKFSGFTERYNSDFGFKYKLIATDKLNLFTELGYRYTIQKAVDGSEQKDHKARLYAEGNKVFSESFNGKLWVEYLPNFSDSDDWSLTFEPSLAFTMSSNFSLKFAYKGIYDQKPAVSGNKKFDFLYTTALIAKF